MTDLYNSIPPERAQTYLQNAEAAFEAGAAPVVEPGIVALGALVLEEAEGLTVDDAQAVRVGDEAQAFADAQKPLEAVGDEAEEYLGYLEVQLEAKVSELASGQPSVE